MRRCLLVLAVLVVTSVLVGSGQAFTSSGGGAPSTVSGYTITDVSYIPDSQDPSRLSAVSFTLAPADAGAVKVRLSPDGGWHACTVALGHASCATPGTSLAAATQLEVLAAD